MNRLMISLTACFLASGLALAQSDAGRPGVSGATQKLEAKKEKTDSLKARAPRKNNKFEEWLKKNEGTRYVYTSITNYAKGGWAEWTQPLDIKHGKVRCGSVMTRSTVPDPNWSKQLGYWPAGSEIALSGRKFQIPRGSFCNGDWLCPSSATISEDGNSITVRFHDRGGELSTLVYKRQR
jgi:hypothetical protein